jgi:hypothetical protein
MIQKPYVAGPVIQDEKLFVGRKEIVNKLIAFLRYEQILVLYGRRRIGKSTILNQVGKKLKNYAQYKTVYIDLQGQLDNSLDKILQLFAYSIRKECNLDHMSYDLGVDSVNYFKTEWLNKVFSELPEVLSIVLLLDEFDDINQSVPSDNTNTFYEYLEELESIFGIRLKIILILGRSPDRLVASARKLLEKANFLPIPLLSLSEVEELTDLSDHELIWDRDSINEIWQLTKGHPFLAQLICSGIWDKYAYGDLGKKLPTIRKEDIYNAISLEEYAHIIEDEWILLPPEEQVVVCMLASKPEGYSTVDILRLVEEKELSEFYETPTVGEILDRLKSDDWIDEVHNRYIINITLYQDWIQLTFKELSHLINVLYDDKKRAFSLLLRAENAQDDLEAIDLLEKSLTLDPDDIPLKNSVVKKIDSIFKLCIKKGENRLALKYADRLSKYDPGLASNYKAKALANLRLKILQQKVEAYLHDNNISQARIQAKEIEKINPDLASVYFKRIDDLQTKYYLDKFLDIVNIWLFKIIFWIPVPLVIIALGQKSFPAKTLFLLDNVQIVFLLICVISSFASALLEANNRSVSSVYIYLTIITASYIFYLLPKIILLNDTNILSKYFLIIITFLSILFVYIFPNMLPMARIAIFIGITAVIIWICYLGGWSAFSEYINILKNILYNPPNIIGDIFKQLFLSLGKR